MAPRRHPHGPSPPWRLALCAACSGAAATRRPRAATPRPEATRRPELPDCPLDALEEADGPVEVTLWYGGIGGSAKADHGGHGGRVQRQPGPGGRHRQRPGRCLRRGVPHVPSAASANRPAPRPRTSRTPSCRPWPTAGWCCPAQACMEADGYDLTHIEPAAGRPTRSTTCSTPATSTCRRRSSTTTRRTSRRPASTPTTRPRPSTSCTRRPGRSRRRGVSDKPFSFKISRWCSRLAQRRRRRGRQQRQRARRAWPPRPRSPRPRPSDLWPSCGR